jgi:hypothetical protein
MIDIGKILKRAWHILWSYKVLWIFGVLLALTTGGAGGGGGSGSGFHYGGSSNYNPNYQPGPFWTSVNNWFQQNIYPFFTALDQHITTFIWIGVGLLLAILVVAVILTFIRYVSEAAVIRMVDDHEKSGAKVGFKQGWRMGWTRAAFRLWLIDLVISLPVIAFLLLMGLLGLGIYLSVKNGMGSTIGIAVSAIGCMVLFVSIVIIVMIFLALLRPFFARTAVLENIGVRAAFRRGWQVIRRNWKSAALLWLVVAGIWIGSWLVSIILLIMLIPVFLVTGVLGLVVAAIPGLAAFGVTSLLSSGPLAWIIAAIVALPFFLLVLLSPLFLIGGWVQVYTSSVWTLAYREMMALEQLAGVPAAGTGEAPGPVEGSSGNRA